MGSITNPSPLGKNVDRIADRINTFALLDKEGDGVHSSQCRATMEIGRRAIVTLSVPHCRHDPKECNDIVHGPLDHMIER